MGGFSGIVRSELAGLNEAAGNPRVAQQLEDRNAQDRNNQLQLALTPLQESLRADQTRLALYANPDDPTKALPGKETEYNATHDRMANTIGQMRQLYGQKPSVNPVEAALGNVADKLHITNHLKNHVVQARANAEAKYQGQNQTMADTAATGALPFAQTPAGQAEAQKTADALKIAGAKGTPDYKNIRGPNGEITTIDLKKDTIPAGWTLAGTTVPTEKPKKGIGFLGSETSPIGLRNLDTGDSYLPSQLGPNGNAPPEYKEAWKTVQAAQKAKQDAEDKKEDERTERQTRALAAVADRMGQTERFQEAMTAYRSDLSTYRALDNLARNSGTTVDSLNYQYKQPGNHAVADNELQNFYTTVVQKGGRKTAAELALTTKIGSFGMNIQTMAQKAANGELPDKLRKALLDGMSSVAAEQRKTADAAKPELPEIAGPEGPTARKNQQAKKKTNDPLGIF